MLSRTMIYDALVDKGEEEGKVRLAQKQILPRVDNIVNGIKQTAETSSESCPGSCPARFDISKNIEQ